MLEVLSEDEIFKEDGRNIVAPKTEEKLKMLIEKTSERVRPFGTGTFHKLNLGDGEKVSLELSTRHLDWIDPDPKNLVVQVGSGTLFDRSIEACLQLGFFIPIPALFNTIGGVVSTNNLGIKSAGFDISRFVVGIEAIVDHGEKVKVGGNVLKTSAGYNLKSAFLGAWGTIGVITKVTLRLHPLPFGTFIVNVEEPYEASKLAPKLKAFSVCVLFGDNQVLVFSDGRTDLSPLAPAGIQNIKFLENTYPKIQTEGYVLKLKQINDIHMIPTRRFIFFPREMIALSTTDASFSTLRWSEVSSPTKLALDPRNTFPSLKPAFHTSL